MYIGDHPNGEVALQRRKIGCRDAFNFGARIANGLGYRERVFSTLRELGWRRMQDMVTERDLCTMYRLTHDENGAELLRSRVVSRSDVSVRATGATSGNQLEVPRVRTEFARRSFFVRAVSAWNELPLATRAAPTISMFRSGIAHVI